MIRLPISLLWSRVTPPVAPAEVPNSGWPSNPGAVITTVGDEFPDEVGENDEVLETEGTYSDVQKICVKVA